MLGALGVVRGFARYESLAKARQAQAGSSTSSGGTNSVAIALFILVPRCEEPGMGVLSAERLNQGNELVKRGQPSGPISDLFLEG